MLALYAAELPAAPARRGGVMLTIVVGVVIASVAGKGTTVAGIAAIANGLLVALAPPAVVIGVVRNLRATGTVTVTVVAGVLCLYLLVGLFFAFTYAAVQNLGGAPFFANGDAATSARSVYFSFVTMTTVGYGDFTARTNLGHTLAVTEALLGQIYLVTVVAAIVSRLVPRGALPEMIERSARVQRRQPERAHSRRLKGVEAPRRPLCHTTPAAFVADARAPGFDNRLAPARVAARCSLWP